MGLFEPRYRSVRINPDPDDLVGAGDELILIRPTCAAMAEYQPLDVPVLTNPGEDSSAAGPLSASQPPPAIRSVITAVESCVFQRIHGSHPTSTCF